MWNDGYYYIPIEGAVIGLDLKLSKSFRLDAKGIEVAAEIAFGDDGLFVMDTDTLIKISL